MLFAVLQLEATNGSSEVQVFLLLSEGSEPRADPDPHKSGKLDRNRIRILIKVKSRIHIQIRISIKVKRWKLYRVILEHWRVQIGEKVSGIRIRITLKGRIRIRIRFKVIGSFSNQTPVDLKICCLLSNLMTCERIYLLY
jgi:hypothetical protein